MKQVERILTAARELLTPIPRLTPSQFAEKYRFLKEGTSPRPGRYSFEGFEFLRSIADTEEEAIETGRNLVFMKPAQWGGSEIMLTNHAWTQVYYPGPSLYLTSKDEVAREFARDRVAYICETCVPLSKKHLKGKAADLVQLKRFTDGKWAISGGKSKHNFESNPYRILRIDEADSLQDELNGEDPIKMAELRLAAYALFGTTLLVAFAHPSTRDHGVGKIYYEQSDQRRGFVPCPHCDKEFWLQWTHVKVFPKAGQKLAEAERDADCYFYVTPCCAVVLTDSERISAARKAVQKSVLPPEVAKTKKWIGVHGSHLYDKRIGEVVREYWLQSIDSPSIMRTTVNKVFGDVYDVAETEIKLEAWVRLIAAEQSGFRQGVVPPGVQWLTAGQDSRRDELHWAVWGWGWVETEARQRLLCGWLVDWGVEDGPRKIDASRTALDKTDLEIFDQRLYGARWNNFRVSIGLHDSGWNPVPIYEYCRERRGVAFPSKGLATNDQSVAPVYRWTDALKYKVGDTEVQDPAARRCDVNTYLLKCDFYGLPEKTFKDNRGFPHTRLTFPSDVDTEFLAHLASEKLVLEEGKRLWKKKSHANHWLDCTLLAYVAAQNVSLLTQQPQPMPAPVTVSESGWVSGASGGSGWSTGSSSGWSNGMGGR